MVTKIMLLIKVGGGLGLKPKDFWCWQGTRKASITQIEKQNKKQTYLQWRFSEKEDSDQTARM